MENIEKKEKFELMKRARPPLKNMFVSLVRSPISRMGR